jgi:hypothetical protein
MFDVPNLHALTLSTASIQRQVSPNFLLSLLRHPAVRQLRSFDVFHFTSYAFSPAELLQLQSLPHLHSLSLWGGWGSCAALQQLPSLPAVTNLSTRGSNETHRMWTLLSRCPHLISVRLDGAIIRSDLIECLAQLPLLQRLHLGYGWVETHDARMWTALRSLREVEVVQDHDVFDQWAPALGFIPGLRLLRWYCRPPQIDPWHLPSHMQVVDALRSLLDAAPLLHLELLLPCTWERWRCRLVPQRHVCSAALMDYRLRVWDELHQMPTQLPRTRIVATELEDDDG